jgi:amino acid adenylation domain-containing protein
VGTTVPTGAWRRDDRATVGRGVAGLLDTCAGRVPELDNAALLAWRAALAHPARPAVVDGNAVADWAEVWRRASATAGALARAGIGPGRRVAVLLERDLDAVTTYFGVLAAGATAVVVNESLRPRQIEHVLARSTASALVASPRIVSRLPRPLAVDVPTWAPADLDGEPIEAVPRVSGDVAHIIFTSGSTGLPKGIAVSHGNVWSGTRAVVDYLGIDADDRIAALLPFSFDYGLSQLFCAAGTGAALVVERTPVAQRIVRTLVERDVTVLAAVPPLWLQLLAVEAFRTPLPSLRVLTNTGGRLPVPAVAALRAAQPHARLYLMYGLTEAFRSTYLDPSLVDDKPGSIGRPIPGAEVMVVADDGAPCAPGVVGELVHRGPTVALGYWDEPAATAARFRPVPGRPAGTPDSERVVWSGDLVSRDEDGDLYFVGRRDALVKTLGHRVNPDEVLDVLFASGQITEGVVLAEDDESRGARLVAVVVLEPDGDAEQLRAFAAVELPRHLQPSRIHAVAEIARTPSGKYDTAAMAGRVRDPV